MRQSKSSVTIRDIAEKCGVSVWTVSKALRNSPAVKEEKARRIRAVAAEMGYDPASNEMARRMINRRYGTRNINHLVAIQLPLDFYQLTYFSRLYGGMLEVLVQEGFEVLTTFKFDPRHLPAKDVAIVSPSLRRGEVDGIITYGTMAVLQGALRQLRDMPQFGDRPIVTLPVPIPGVSSVVSDDKTGAYQAARHLLELGHRHLLLFIYDREATREEMVRCESVRIAMREFGLHPEEYLHLLRTPPDWFNPNYTGAKSFPPTLELRDKLLDYLKAHPYITAALCGNDATALHFSYQLAKFGLRIPEDMSLIGYDDTDPLKNSMGENILTTVQIPLVDMGRAAAKLLIDRITDKEPADKLVTLPTRLITRASTAPPRSTPLVL